MLAELRVHHPQHRGASTNSDRLNEGSVSGAADEPTEINVVRAN